MSEALPSFPGSVEQRSEKVRGKILKRNGIYVASVGKHTVPIEENLARNIDVAIRIQDKVDDALAKGNRPGFLRTVKMMNCRKSVFAVTGIKNARELVDRTKIKRLTSANLSNRERVKISYDIAGGRELKEDIERLLELGKLPILGSGSDMHFESHLDEHRDDVPAIAHVFEVPPLLMGRVISGLMDQQKPLSAEFILSKLHRVHTFLVLGKDKDTNEYLAFQKKGPDLHQRFEVTTLKTIATDSYFNMREKLFLTCIGPMPKQEINTTE